MKNETYIQEIKELIKKFPKHYAKMLHKTERKYLADYILESTKDLLSSDFFTFTTRTYFCINDLHEFPICPTCSKVIDNKNVANIMLGYNQYCSRSCINKDPNIRKKIDQTNLEKYGVTNALCLESSKEKNRQIKAANRKPPKPRIRKTKEELSLAHKHGYQKYIKTVKERHGVENISQLQSIKDKKKNTFNKHKNDDPNFLKNARNKAKNTTLKRYGVESPSQSYEIHKKQVSKYYFNGKKFNSAAEIVFFIWLTDNKIDFEYEPNIKLIYEFKGKQHRYFPDFLVNGEIIEIKGDHFFDTNGLMRCPFRKKSWSKEKKKEIDEHYEAKHQCMLKNNVKILKYSEMEKYFEYVGMKYGKDYLRQFKIFT